VLVALNLLNHEQSAFLLPWLLYVRHAAGALRLRPDAVLGALVLGLYAIWRASIDTGVVALHVAYTVRPAADYVAEYGMVWWFLLTSLGFLLVCLCWYAAAAGSSATASSCASPARPLPTSWPGIRPATSTSPRACS
jgi:hypothetical protein